MNLRGRFVAASAVAAVAVAGGAIAISGDDHPTTHDLVIGTARQSVGFPAVAPGARATHFAGSFLPCLKHGGAASVERVEILGATPNAEQDTRVYVRRTPAASVRDKVGPGASYAPVLSGDGPVMSNENLASSPGPYELLVPGSRLAVKCLDGPRDVDAARDEVVVEVSADERGVDVSDVVVHYTLGRARGSARVLSRVVICGTQVVDDFCSEVKAG